MSSKACIVDAVNAYVNSKNTHYAIMVDGDWGSGKTYLFKNEIIPSIGEEETIYISLFGLKSIRDIENELFKVLSKISEGGQGLKDLLNSSSVSIDDMKVGGLGYILQVGLDKRKRKIVSKGKKLTLFFDDLERWGGDLSVCLSYINKLVEHEDSKCILIGCLGQLKEKSQEEILVHREKTIRHVYRLENSIEVVLDVSLGLVCFSSEEVSDFTKTLVNENILRISEILNSSEYYNIRIVGESIQLFNNICSNHFDTFKKSPALVISYYCSLLSMLILLKKYIKDLSLNDALLEYNDEQESYKFLQDNGYYDTKNPHKDLIPKAKQLIESIFYGAEEIKLRGLMSIIKNGYYIESDFRLDFESWNESEAYEYYLDTFYFWSMPDKEAANLFGLTTKQIFDEKKIRNPITLLRIADRLTIDIKRGAVDIDFEETKKKLISLFQELYNLDAMERVKGIYEGSIHSDFSYSRDIYDEVVKLNESYVSRIESENQTEFWNLLKSNPDNMRELTTEYQEKELFSIYEDPQEIVDCLEVFTNEQLFNITRWMGSRVGNPRYKQAVSQEVRNTKSLVDLILENYSECTVRNSHFKQIARILQNNRVDYDPEYIDSQKNHLV